VQKSASRQSLSDAENGEAQSGGDPATNGTSDQSGV